MPTRSGQTSPASTPVAPRMYPPELQSLLQSLLAALADIDFAHLGDIETVRNSTIDDCLKQAVIRRLEESHRRRRAPLSGSSKPGSSESGGSLRRPQGTHPRYRAPSRGGDVTAWR